MIGTFVTAKYDDARCVMARQPSEVLVARNAFVGVGLELMWRILAGQARNDQGGLSDHLGKARLIVGNGATPVTLADERLAGTDTAYAELDDGFPTVARTDRGAAITFRATFTEDVANFDWTERGVTSVQGVLIDRSVEDHGRKAPGTIWTLAATLELTA